MQSHQDRSMWSARAIRLFGTSSQSGGGAAITTLLTLANSGTKDGNVFGWEPNVSVMVQ